MYESYFIEERVGSMMDANKTKQESISALMDGELSIPELMRELSQCHRVDDRDTWAVYHQIGDVLRSKELAQPFSEGFDARMRARLDAEPVHGAKLPVNTGTEPHSRGIGGVLAGLGGLTVYGIGISGILALTAMAVVVVNLPSSHPRVDPVLSSVAVDDATVMVSTVGEHSPSEHHLAEYVVAHKRMTPSFYSDGDARVPATIMAGSN